MNLLVTVALLLLPLTTHAARCPADARFGLVIHGGAWRVDDKDQEAYRKQMESHLRSVHQRMAKGESSLEAVLEAVRLMEDSGTLNAGKAGVATSEGTVELDASVMDGRTGKAGAVGSVRTLKNPVLAARLVMQKTKHVLLVGRGAEKFASEQGATVVGPEYFINNKTPNFKDRKGTVGAVALDCHGNLAAATSTGGLEGKLPGRLGDSPIIGAGTYANNDTVAVSGTGTGEYFIRASIAYDVHALMDYKRASLAEASAEVIKKLTAKGGDGGIIAIDRDGHIAAPYNGEGMLYGHIDQTGTTNIGF